MNRHPAHILLLKAARALELLIAAVILLVIVCSLGDFGYYCSEFHHGCFKVDKDAVGGYVEYLAW